VVGGHLEQKDLKVTLYKRFTISASHTVKGHGKCSNLHGHNFGIEVYVTCDRLLLKEPQRFFLDFGAIKELVQDEFDHKHLNAVLNMESVTCEVLAAEIFRLLGDYIARQYPDELERISLRVRVWETPSSSVEVSGRLG